MTDAAAGDAPAVAPLIRSRSFLAFWIGQTFSEFGAQLGGIAIPVIAVTALAASALQVGVLGALDTAAFLIIGLPAGAWLDRMRKRQVMRVADLGRALVLAWVPVAAVLRVLTIDQLYVVGALVSVGTVFFDVGYQSFIPFMVAREQVGEANGKLETTSQISGIAGPAVSGVLLSILQAPLLLIAPVVTYLGSFAVLTRVRDSEPVHDPGDRRPLAVEIREGLAFVAGHPLIRRITAATATANFFGALTTTLLPLLVLRQLGLAPAVLGFVYAGGAVGGLLGAISANRLGARIGEGTVIPIGLVICGLGAFLTPIAAVVAVPAASIPLLIASSFGTSFGGLVYNITQVSFRQRVCPPRLLGRMNASIRFVVWGIMPIGALLAGLLGSTLGVRGTIWIGAAGELAAALIVGLSPLRGMRKLPDA